MQPPGGVDGGRAQLDLPDYSGVTPLDCALRGRYALEVEALLWHGVSCRDADIHTIVSMLGDEHSLVQQLREQGPVAMRTRRRIAKRQRSGELSEEFVLL